MRRERLSLNPQKLEEDRFSAGRLYGKLANICSDPPGERLSSSAMFKAITGCDRITAEVKYRDSFEFTPFARLLFSANRLPPSNDASQTFFDRWLVGPLANRFRHTRREIPRRILEARLSTPNELSGALNKALDGLGRLRKSFRFTELKDSRAAMRKYQATNDALAEWTAFEADVREATSRAATRCRIRSTEFCRSARLGVRRNQHARGNRRLRTDQVTVSCAKRLINGLQDGIPQLLGTPCQPSWMHERGASNPTQVLLDDFDVFPDRGSPMGIKKVSKGIVLSCGF